MASADVMTAANESTLRVINFAQDQFLKVYKGIASRVPTVFTPSWLTPDVERSREAIEEAFNFQSQLLESRKAFALGLLDAGAESEAADSEAAKKVTAATKK
jgi:hypothetical protein